MDEDKEVSQVFIYGIAEQDLLDLLRVTGTPLVYINERQPVGGYTVLVMEATDGTHETLFQEVK